MINNKSNDALEQAAPPSVATTLRHLAVPDDWRLVPAEPTPEIIAGAAIASWPTATLADIDLARQAAPLVLMQMDMAPGTTVDALAGMLATMAPAYRAMLAAAPKYWPLPAAAPQVAADERAALLQNVELVINRLETIGCGNTDIPRELAHEALVCARAALAAAPVQEQVEVTDAGAGVGYGKGIGAVTANSGVHPFSSDFRFKVVSDPRKMEVPHSIAPSVAVRSVDIATLDAALDGWVPPSGVLYRKIVAWGAQQREAGRREVEDGAYATVLEEARKLAERAEKAEDDLKQVNEWRAAALTESQTVGELWAAKVEKAEARVKELETELDIELERAYDRLLAARSTKQNGRQAQQADGKHPAPCARSCEAPAYQSQLRGRDARIAELEALLARRRAPLSPETQQAIADARAAGQTIAATPGGLVFMNDGAEPGSGELDCPACGGSGHAGDVVTGSVP